MPNAFDGTKRTLRGFLIQIRAYHQFHTINLSYLNDKMQNVATFIKSDTLEWIEPLFRDFFEYNNDDQNPLTRKVFNLYKDFEVKFKIVFGEMDKKRAAKRQFAKFKQTGSASYYAIQFYQNILQLY